MKTSVKNDSHIETHNVIIEYVGDPRYGGLIALYHDLTTIQQHIYLRRSSCGGAMPRFNEPIDLPMEC